MLLALRMRDCTSVAQLLGVGDLLRTHGEEDLGTLPAGTAFDQLDQSG